MVTIKVSSKAILQRRKKSVELQDYLALFDLI